MESWTRFQIFNWAHLVSSWKSAPDQGQGRRKHRLPISSSKQEGPAGWQSKFFSWFSSFQATGSMRGYLSRSEPRLCANGKQSSMELDLGEGWVRVCRVPPGHQSHSQFLAPDFKEKKNLRYVYPELKIFRKKYLEKLFHLVNAQIGCHFKSFFLSYRTHGKRMTSSWFLKLVPRSGFRYGQILSLKQWSPRCH